MKKKGEALQREAVNAQKSVDLLEDLSPGSGGAALELMSSASWAVQCSCSELRCL